jgi:hypothetical protein
MTLAPRSAILLLAAPLLLPAFPARAQDDPVPPQVQSSIDRGLSWLAHHQQTDGQWLTNVDHGPSVAITSLAAMAFMARGHVPGQGPYGDNLNKAVDFILSKQAPSGLLASNANAQTMYDHGIATVMLCEACGMLDDARQERVKTAVSKAVRLILNAQNIPKDPGSAGGWRYFATSPDSDISVTGWQLMALRGAANIGADIPQRAIANGIAYIRRRQTPSGGFTYSSSDMGGSTNPARTGTGVLALELLGQHDSKESLAGGAYLLKNPIRNDPGTHYFYTVYYCSQAAYQLGGKYWEVLAPTIRDSLLQRQGRDGSWSVSQSTEAQGGPAYGTAMAILALAVPYRYLPIYQR